MGKLTDDFDRLNDEKMDKFDQYMIAFIITILAAIVIGLLSGFVILLATKPLEVVFFLGGMAVLALIVHLVAKYVVKEDM